MTPALVIVRRRRTLLDAVLDDEHYQAFDGDLIGRRTLGSLTVRW